MKPIYEKSDAYDSAVAKTAESFISRFGKSADDEAWKAARHPAMTPAERAYCEAVAIRVTQRMREIPR